MLYVEHILINCNWDAKIYPVAWQMYLQLEAINTGENHSGKYMEQRKTFLFNLLVKIGGHRPKYS